MSAEGGSLFVLEDEFVSNFRAGWTVEIECTETVKKLPTLFRGGWVLRCISNDGRIRTLATKRNLESPRKIKTSFGLESFVYDKLGFRMVPVMFEKAMVCRFNKDGWLP